MTRRSMSRETSRANLLLSPGRLAGAARPTDDTPGARRDEAGRPRRAPGRTPRVYQGPEAAPRGHRVEAANRIDHLPDGRRLRGLTRDLLAGQPDEVLQTIVAAAAARTGAPIALVSLVLDDIQFFKAHHGLPPDLAEIRGTARDMSFCQLVVRDDDQVEIEDARMRPDVPQALVDAYGIRSYLGAPIHLEDQPLGSLCVIDVHPRTFSPADREALGALAREVDARIAELTRAAAGRSPPPRVEVSPVFWAIRNHLSPLTLTSDELRLLRAELATHLRGVQTSAGESPVLPDAARFQEKLDALDEAADWVEDATRDLLGEVERLEELVDTRRLGTPGATLVQVVDRLCGPLAETIGGLRWDPPPAGLRVGLASPRAGVLVGTVLTTLIVRLAPRGPGGLRAGFGQSRGQVVLEFASPAIVPGDAPALMDALADDPSGAGRVTLEGGEGALRLRLPAA